MLVEAWMLDNAIAVRNDLPRALASGAISSVMLRVMMLLHREVGYVSVRHYYLLLDDLLL